MKKNIFTKQVIYIIMLLSVLMVLTACNSKNKIEKEANKIVKAVNTKELSKVDAIINEKENLTEDEDLMDFFNQNEESSDGIISQIIKYDKIKIKKIKNDKIIYKITSPDLSNIFIDMKKGNISNENAKTFVVDYISNASKKTYEIDVFYTYKDGKFLAEYKSEDFINALTGNLVTAYQELIEDATNEMRKENEDEKLD